MPHVFLSLGLRLEALLLRLHVHLGLVALLRVLRVGLLVRVLRIALLVGVTLLLILILMLLLLGVVLGCLFYAWVVEVLVGRVHL